MTSVVYDAVCRDRQCDCDDHSQQYRAMWKKLRSEAYLEWLCQTYEHISDASLLQMLSTKKVVPSELQLNAAIVSVAFPEWMSHLDVSSLKLVQLLNTVIESKLVRISLGDFHLETPYERLCSAKNKLSKKYHRNSQQNQHNNDFEAKDVEVAEEERKAIAEASAMRRAALEEKCYVRLLLNRGLRPGSVIEAVERMWDDGELLIERSELDDAVEVEFLLEWRKMREMVGLEASTGA